MLTFFSASNGIVNSQVAMANALRSAFGNEQSADCDLIIFHCTMGHNFSALLMQAKQMAPSARIVGCTCAGIIGKEGPNDTMKALAIMAIRGNEGDFSVAWNNNLNGVNSFDVASQLADGLKSKHQDINMVMIIASGIDIAADKTIEGIESVLGPVPIFGGTSSDNMKAISSFQFIDQEILERGIILIGFSDASLSIHTRAHHGNIPIGRPFTVTKSEGNRVLEIDEKPAWPYITTKLGLTESAHPGQMIVIGGLGQMIPQDEQEDYDNPHILRAILSKDENNLSFYLPVDCPKGTNLWLTRRDEDLILGGLDKMIHKLQIDIEGRQLVAIFHTDCAARGKEMFNQSVKEEMVRKMQSSLCRGQEIPWLGMYGFGEFASLIGRNRFHNYTTSIYALTRSLD